jgi:plastocyanin
MMSQKTSGMFLMAAAMLCAAGCGGVKSEAPKKAAEKKPVEYFHVDPATAASVHGRIVFVGEKPPQKAISMEADAACQQAHQGKKVYEESVVTGNGGGLANAFVYIKAGLEGKNFEAPKEPVQIVQHGCKFEPRAIGVQAGQNVDVKNADPVSHNFHAMPSNNRDWDQQQSPGAADMEHRFPRPEIMIPVKCNVHSWMRAYIGVMPHPYFAVTAADGGFELRNVPPGDYTVAAWHEKFGEQTAQVHVAANGKEAVDFKFK